jgi:predicted RND superfamily exporter protein
VEDGLGPYSLFALFFVFIVSSADLFHYFSKLANNGQQSSDTIYTSRKQIIWPCFLTSLANAIGFGSLMFNENVLIRNFGFYCTIGIIACFILTFLILPWILTLFSFDPKSLYVTPVKVDGRQIWKLINAKNRPILLGSLAIFVILTVTGYDIRIDDNVYDSFVPSHDMTKSVKQYTDGFSFMGSVDVVFHGKTENIRSETNERLMAEFEADILALPQVSYLKSYTQLMASLRSEVSANYPTYSSANIEPIVRQIFPTLNGYRVFRSLYSDSSEKLRTVVFLHSLHSAELTSTLDAIRKLAQNPKYSRAIEVSPNGFSVIRNYINSNVIDNFVKSFVPSLILIFFVFCFIFRSFKWGLLCMIPNLYPLVTITGLMGLFGVTMESNLVILVCITLGLCVDDTIHFACGLKEGLKRNLSYEQALRECFHDSSDALIATTLNLVVSFPVFFIGDLRLYTQVGIFILISLIVGLIADFVVFPAVLLRYGKAILPRHRGNSYEFAPLAVETEAQ